MSACALTYQGFRRQFQSKSTFLKFLSLRHSALVCFSCFTGLDSCMCGLVFCESVLVCLGSSLSRTIVFPFWARSLGDDSCSHLVS